MTTISWRLDVSVAGGPSAVVAQSVSAEAYDKIVVELVDGAPEQTVEIGAATGDVLLLLITSTEYGSDLSYKVNATGNPAHVLDGPLHLAGSGAIDLLGFSPTALLFTNSLGTNVTVEILVARDATPP